MAFDQSTITEVTATRSGHDLKIAWTSSAADGTWFQVYVGSRLIWFGTSRACKLAWPHERVAIDIGAVLVSEARTDLSSTLPSVPSDRAKLSWQGGTFLDPAIAGFSIYSSAVPGGSVSYTAAIAKVPAYHGVITDGYNLGGFGQGGFSASAGDYTWTSSPLLPGVWTFAVVPYDSSGNQCASPTTTTVTVSGPPRPPASDSRGIRLKYSYNASTHVATLNWLASPT